MPRSATGAQRYFERRAQSAEYQRAYATARAQISTVDDLIQTLDEVRRQEGISKAELGRRAQMAPEAVRRIFTAQRSNPTIDTVVKLATALGVEIKLAPRSRRRAAASPNCSSASSD